MRREGMMRRGRIRRKSRSGRNTTHPQSFTYVTTIRHPRTSLYIILSRYICHDSTKPFSDTSSLRNLAFRESICTPY